MNFHRLIEISWSPITFVVLVAITILSLIPLPEFPELPGTDKSHHLIAYAVLMLPAFLAGHKWRLHLMLFFFLYSGCIELIQPWINRYGEFLDWAANGAGLIIGALIGLCLNMVFNRLLS